MHIGNAQRLGNCVGAAAIVTGQQVAADVADGELLHGLQRTGLEGVTEGEQTQHARLGTLLDQPGQGPAFGFPGRGRIDQ
ncbi:hypothetical protein D3C84_514750 [compost metagenome]